MKLVRTAVFMSMLDVLGDNRLPNLSLTDEEFERQRHGQPEDSEVGTVVGAAGTVGYFGYLGAMIGAAVAGKH
jgi:hypothetical protein